MPRPRRRTLIWRLYLSYLVVLLVALVAIAVFASREVRSSHLKETSADLLVRVHLTRTILERRAGPFPGHGLQALCRELGHKAEARVTVILPSGRVVGDSQREPATLDDHGDRPEIRRALAGRTGRSTRYSSTLDHELMYVASPVMRNQRILAVVRVAVPLRAISKTLRAIYWRITLAGLLVALLGARVSLTVARRFNRPLKEMQEGAARFAAGDLNHRLAVPDVAETGGLAEAMNQMAAQLGERIRTIREQRSQLATMLSSMIEAVLVTDPEGRLRTVNRAAEELFGVTGDEARGKTIQEAVRNSDLHRLVKDLLRADGPREADIVIHRAGDRFLRASGAPLHDETGALFGSVVVLHDVTRLQRLEVIRRDFVANVSHELKTPITAIQGFVETLRDGALEEPENARRFLDIVARQAERLDQIIEDLLSLSRLERGHEEPILRPPSRAGDILTAVREVCDPKAAEAGVHLEDTGALASQVMGNAALLEQALVNLTDNAIKYGGEGSTVQLTVSEEPGGVVFAVKDDGCGIPLELQARIFERFYRVDKARSRKLGGTGLGLAIVKHIAAVHGGTVSVESAPGKGSTFRIHIPHEKEHPSPE